MQILNKCIIKIVEHMVFENSLSISKTINFILGWYTYNKSNPKILCLDGRCSDKVCILSAGI